MSTKILSIFLLVTTVKKKKINVAFNLEINPSIVLINFNKSSLVHVNAFSL